MFIIDWPLKLKCKWIPNQEQLKAKEALLILNEAIAIVKDPKSKYKDYEYCLELINRIRAPMLASKIEVFNGTARLSFAKINLIVHMSNLSNSRLRPGLKPIAENERQQVTVHLHFAKKALEAKVYYNRNS